MAEGDLKPAKAMAQAVEIRFPGESADYATRRISH
jgi:hypothetical protein